MDRKRINFPRHFEPSGQHRTQLSQATVLHHQIPSTNRICVLENILIQPAHQNVPTKDSPPVSMQSKSFVFRHFFSHFMTYFISIFEQFHPSVCLNRL